MSALDHWSCRDQTAQGSHFGVTAMSKILRGFYTGVTIRIVADVS